MMVWIHGGCFVSGSSSSSSYNGAALAASQALILIFGPILGFHAVKGEFRAASDGTNALSLFDVMLGTRMYSWSQ